MLREMISKVPLRVSVFFDDNADCLWKKMYDSHLQMFYNCCSF